MKPNSRSIFVSWALIVACGVGLGRTALAIDPNVRQLVDWETRANAVSLRSNDPIQITHFEIPFELLRSEISVALEPEVKDALVFERDGKRYLRWIINPEDTKWHMEVSRWMESKGLDATPKHHFTGYLTASRSLIIEDPVTGAQFSGKVSTNKTGGNWTDKKQSFRGAFEGYEASEYLRQVSEVIQFEHFVLMLEPAVFGIEAIDQGFMIRSLRGMRETGHYYMPGFSVVHQQAGVQTAEQNSLMLADGTVAVSVEDYFEQTYAARLGAALAELAAHTGIVFEAPHGQNFLEELGADMKPTGRIVLRDFGDTYLNPTIVDASIRPSLIRLWSPSHIKPSDLSVRFGPLHGNHAPTWMTASGKEKWAKTFMTRWETEFSELTGVTIETLAKTRLDVSQYSYSGKVHALRADDEAWKPWFNQVKCLQGVTATACSERIRRKQVKNLTPELFEAIRKKELRKFLLGSEALTRTEAPMSLRLEAALEVFRESRTDAATKRLAAETVRSVLVKALANPGESLGGTIYRKVLIDGADAWPRLLQAELNQLFLQAVSRAQIPPGLESAVADSGVFTSKNWLTQPENLALLKILVRKDRFAAATAAALLEDVWKGSGNGGSLHREYFARSKVDGNSIRVLLSGAVPGADAIGLLMGRMDAGSSTSQVDTTLSLLPPDHWLKSDPGIFKVLKHSLRVSPGEAKAVARVLAGLGLASAARFKTMTAIVLRSALAQGEAALRVTAFELFESAQFLQRPDAIRIKRESLEITALDPTIERRFLKTPGFIAHSEAAPYIAWTLEKDAAGTLPRVLDSLKERSEEWKKSGSTSAVLEALAREIGRTPALAEGALSFLRILAQDPTWLELPGMRWAIQGFLDLRRPEVSEALGNMRGISEPTPRLLELIECLDRSI